MGVDSDILELLLLEATLEGRGGIALTRGTEFLVQLLSTIWRGIGLHLYGYFLIGGLLGVLYGVLPLLYLILVQLSGTDIRLLDLEHDVGIIGLLDDTLEAIRGGHWGDTSDGSECLGSDDTVTDLEVRQWDDLLTLLTLEAQIELALGHSRLVRDGEGNGRVGAFTVGDYPLVALYLFTLEGRLCSPLLTALVADDRDDSQLSVLGEPLSWEGEVHCTGYLTSDELEGLRFSLSLISCERTQLSSTATQDDECCQGERSCDDYVLDH